MAMESKSTFCLNLGMHIRKIRNEKNVTLKELALRIDSTEQTLSAIENGRHNTTTYFIARICDGLKISVSEFYRDF